MIRKIVRSIAVACLLFMCMPFGVSAAEFPAWNKFDYFIQDHAKILSNEQKEELNRLGKNLEQATGAELAVLTIPSIGDEPVEQYAVDALREYGLGKQGKDNGALLVVTTIPNSSDDHILN